MQKSVYLCSLCKKQFSFEDIRYSHDGKRIVCMDCYSKIRATQPEPKEEGAMDIPNKVKLICVDCRYKFSTRKGVMTRLMCPYCGSNKLIKDDITAQKIIEEVSNSKDYF